MRDWLEHSIPDEVKASVVAVAWVEQKYDGYPEVKPNPDAKPERLTGAWLVGRPPPGDMLFIPASNPAAKGFDPILLDGFYQIEKPPDPAAEHEKTRAEVRKVAKIALATLTAAEESRNRKHKLDTNTRRKGAAERFPWKDNPVEFRALVKEMRRREKHLEKNGVKRAKARAIRETKDWFNSKFPDCVKLLEDCSDPTLRNYLDGKTGKEALRILKR